MPKDGYYQPSRQLISQNDRAIIENAEVPRSRFTGSWSHKTTFDAGYLVPFLVDEILPGDSMNYKVTAYVRMSTPLFPILDNQRIDTFFFFVPCRILWTNWAKFMGEQDFPTESIAFTVPTLELEQGVTVGLVEGSLFDHFGLPSDAQLDPAQSVHVNALPFRAYYRILNYWFRDQNIIAKYQENTGDGPDVADHYGLQRRAKSHDYFTSALPWPQKFVAPTVPIGGLAPVTGLGKFTDAASAGPLNSRETDQTIHSYSFYSSVDALWSIEMSQDDPGSWPMVFADLAGASGVAINTFRQAFLVQQLLERDARGGTRYVELIRSHFGVTSPDFRLQRPEYIGGGQTGFQITPVAQTAPSAGVPVGALGAAGTASGQHSASYAATEHGYIIGLINVRSELSYQQRLHKMWTRATRFDFYFPSLAGLGEQAILRKEIYATGTVIDDETVFGYQERWHEYRARESEVTGMFRSDATGTLDAWHLAQQFSTAPTLSEAFINDTPPMDRVLAAGALAVDQQYLADIFIQRQAVRPMPMFGTPVKLGRF